MINIVSGHCENVSPEYVSCMGKGIPERHDNKISRPSARFMINRTQLKFNPFLPNVPF